jgi:hypothetical protein
VSFKPQAINGMCVMKKKRDKTSQLVRRGEAPEEALFRNVVTQAIEDATMRLPTLSETTQARLKVLIRDQAREWVRRQGEDFRLVCELAGLEASCVHQFAMTKIRESIERENAKTAERLTSAMPGVVSNFLEGHQDRHTSDARGGPEIGFSCLNGNSESDQTISVATSDDMAAAEVKL